MTDGLCTRFKLYRNRSQNGIKWWQWCWWLQDRDDLWIVGVSHIFCMLVTDANLKSKRMLVNKMVKTFINILKLSPTYMYFTRIVRYYHRRSHFINKAYVKIFIYDLKYSMVYFHVTILFQFILQHLQTVTWVLKRLNIWHLVLCLSYDKQQGNVTFW